MKKVELPKKLLDKKIPTLLGLFVLVIALIAGTLLLGDGPGVFAPRATPSTTPKKIKITNVTDNSFAISFLTDESTPAFVKYGTEEKSLKSQASDDRDQLSGTVSDYQIHHITIRGLQQSTNYYYTLGTGSGSTFDNGGKPFVIKTAARSGAPAAAKTIYGSVSNSAGNPAEGSIVYVSLANAGDMSSLVKKSGSWAVPLSNARTKDGTKYAEITDLDNIILSIQGSSPADLINYSTTVSEAQPVPTLTFGQELPANQVTDTAVIEEVVAEETIDTEPETITEESQSSSSAETDFGLDDIDFNELDELDELADLDLELDNSSRSAILDEITQETTESSTSTTPTKTVIDLEATSEAIIVDTAQPKIIGKALPNVVISIQVHSDTQINQELTADANGDFELDIAALSENLEPGPHEVTYSYTDPATGEVVTKTVNFVVEEPAEQLALAEPYGSGNPYPPATTSPTPTPASESATATDEAEASDSGRVSLPATDEAIPVSGSVGTTLALVFGGLFFIISGLWSFWISHQLGKDEIEI